MGLAVKLEIGCLYLFESTADRYCIVLVDELDSDGKGVLNAFDKAWLYFVDWTPIGRIPLHPIESA
ncbi:MAG: hypothetical protein Q8N98_01905 [bacterium]|nr:hypothetical protein [bacterium]